MDATEEREHLVIVTDTVQENESIGLVDEKNVSQKRYNIYAREEEKFTLG